MQCVGVPDAKCVEALAANAPLAEGYRFELLGRAEVGGVCSCEFDHDTVSVHAGIGVVAPRHRGANLAQAGIWFAEAIVRRLGMGLAYGMATLKAPHAQRAFERAGWQLVGITPGTRALFEPLFPRTWPACLAA